MIRSSHSDESYFELYSCSETFFSFSAEQYEAISKEIVIREADARYPTSKNRPPKISCVLDTKTGIYYIGESGREVAKIHPILQARMPEKSLTEWERIDNCAEFQAVNAALFDGAEIRDLVGTTIVTKDHVIASPCENCKITCAGVTFSPLTQN